MGAAGAAVAWGHFEAGWVRLRTLDVDLPGLPLALDGLRVVHLSDLHLGVPSRGEHAVERAVEWTRERRPDLVLVSGDLLSRVRGAPHLGRLLGDLPNCYAVLGNHDFGDSRDPLSAPSPVTELGSATLLFDDARMVDLRGCRVQIVGVDPRSYHARRARPDCLVDQAADLRILLCHFPGIIERLPAGAFHLVLAGHVHAGQITLPYPGGRIRFSQLRGGYLEGVYRRPTGVLHVSPGLGTTFVPFRFLARPEATELVLHPA